MRACRGRSRPRLAPTSTGDSYRACVPASGGRSGGSRHSALRGRAHGAHKLGSTSVVRRRGARPGRRQVPCSIAPDRRHHDGPYARDPRRDRASSELDACGLGSRERGVQRHLQDAYALSESRILCFEVTDALCELPAHALHRSALSCPFQPPWYPSPPARPRDGVRRAAVGAVHTRSESAVARRVAARNTSSVHTPSISALVTSRRPATRDRSPSTGRRGAGGDPEPCLSTTTPGARPISARVAPVASVGRSPGPAADRGLG